MMNVHPEVVGLGGEAEDAVALPIGFRTPVRFPTTASATGRVGEVRMRRMNGVSAERPRRREPRGHEEVPGPVEDEDVAAAGDPAAPRRAG